MNTRFLSIFALAMVGASSFASITIQFNGTGLGQSVDFVYNNNAQSGFAGQLYFTDLTDNVAMTTYCVDLDHHIGTGATFVVDVSNSQGDATFDLPGRVYANSQATAVANDSAA